MKSNLCEAYERHALIIGYSLEKKFKEEGKLPLAAQPTVLESVNVVESFARRYNFTSVNVLKDSKATKNAINRFFAE
jgi:hypothetical protein